MSRSEGVKVYASRDFRSYRPVTSPVTTIADRFYSFVSSSSPESTHARYAYATAYLGYEPPAGAPFAGSDLDAAVQNMLETPPVIVLAQGPMQPWGLFGPEFEAERQSVASSVSDTAVVVEPVSAVRTCVLLSIRAIILIISLDLPPMGGASSIERCARLKRP
jgi:hypothetical protein